MELAESKNNKKSSHFSIKDGMVLILNERGCSKAKAEEFLREGLISYRGREILKLLSELTALTAKQVKDCFLLKSIDEDLKKDSLNKDKNPYLSDIKRLRSLGLILEGKISLRDTERVKFYYLSPQMHRFAAFLRGTDGLFETGETKYRKIKGEKDALRILSANEFHIKALLFCEDMLKEYTTLYQFRLTEYNSRLIDNNGYTILTFCVRSDKDKEALLLAVSNTKYLGSKAYLVIISPNPAQSKRAEEWISKENGNIPDYVCFTDDFEVHQSLGAPQVYEFIGENMKRCRIFKDDIEIMK